MSRNRYVYALIGAPCEPDAVALSPTEDSNRLVARLSLVNTQTKSSEERAASYLAGVEHDLITMREFFGRGQDIEELFSYNHVDSQGKEWVVEKLRQAFARTDVHAFFIYYTGHGYADDGAWYLGAGRTQNGLAPTELFRLWEESLSGQSGESVLVVICDSCHSGRWVEAAKNANLKHVAVQAATDGENPTYDSEMGGVFTYRVYNRGTHVFQSIFSLTGFFTAFATGIWVIIKETAALFLTRAHVLFPQVYVPDQFNKVMSRSGGSLQPSKVVNHGRFLFIDTFEWIMFR